MTEIVEPTLCNARKVIEPATDLQPEVDYICGRPMGHQIPVEGKPFSVISKVHIAYGENREVLCVWKDESDV